MVSPADEDGEGDNSQEREDEEMKGISSVLVITWEVTWGCPQTSGFISNRGKSSASQFECNHQDNILQDSVKEGAVGKPSDSLGCLAQTGTQLA